MAKSDELTESEREWLAHPYDQVWPNITRKALRIIEAHAADRAALVAQLEAATTLLNQAYQDLINERSKIREALKLCEPYAGRLAPIVAALRGEGP